MKAIGDLVYNKDIWTLLSATFKNASDEVARHELLRAHKQLLCGVNVYQKPKPTSDGNQGLRSQVPEKLFAFVKNLEVLLELDCIQAYDLLCFYVLYEFRGTGDALQQFLANDIKKSMLLHDIWLFYRSERMFLLKCINLIWTYCTDSDHPYQCHYAEFIAKDSLESAFVAHLLQFDSVTNERMPIPATHSSYLTTRIQNIWFVSNLREQIQVLHNLIIYLDLYNSKADDVIKLFNICKRHSFGRDQQLNKSTNKECEQLRETIGYMECILLIQSLQLQSLLSNVDKYKLFQEGCTVYDSLDSEMNSLGSLEAHGPLLIVWMIISYSHPKKDPAFGLYQQFGEKAIHLDVFEYLTRLLKHSMFQHSSKLSNLAFQCVSDLLAMITSCFEIDYLTRLPGVFSLAQVLFTNANISGQYWNGDQQEGVGLIVTEAMKYFPHKYMPFINIVESLASCKSLVHTIPSLMALLHKLPWYTETMNPSVISSSLVPLDTCSSDAGFHQLTSQRRHFKNIVIPAGTLARIFSENTNSMMVQWYCSVNFFDIIFEEESKLLQQISSGSNYVLEESLIKVTATVKCLASLLENNCHITSDVSEAVEIIFLLIDKFSSHSNPPGELLASCLDVSSALLTTFPEQVCHRFKHLQFLPSIDMLKCSDPIRLASGEFFTLNTVGLVMANHECLTGEFPLLLSYLRFIDRVMQPNEGDTFDAALQKNFEIILPGLVLIVRVVFPNYASWQYANEDVDKAWIAHYSIRIIHLILSTTAFSETKEETIHKENEKEKEIDIIRRKAPYLLHTICLYSLLQTDTCLPLLRLIATGDRYIQALMERQPSWLVGHGILFTNNVQLAMSVLNRTLLLKNTIHSESSLCKIETLLYCQPTPSPILNVGPQLRVVLVVANYIYHCFNPKLPILGVKLLKRFALEFPISLMSCLGIDGYAICQSFIARLDSLIECDELKVAILELISSSIVTQPGLIEAFINLHHPPRSDTPGGCLIFVCLTLENLVSKPTSVSVDLHEGIIGLLYALWMADTQSVLTYLRSKAHFYDGLCAPFFMEMSASQTHLLCKILSIFTLELYAYQGRVPKQLETNLFQLFDIEGNHLSRWLKFVSSSLARKKSNGKCEASAEGLLQAWKEFLTVYLKHSPFKIHSEQKHLISSHIMATLLIELKTLNNPVVLKQSTDLYLLLIINWKNDCFENRKLAMKQFEQLVSHVSLTYQSLSATCNEGFLALIIRLLTLFHNDIQIDAAAADLITQFCCQIIATELLLVHKNNKVNRDKVNPIRESLCSTLAVCLMQKLILFLNGSHCWERHFRHYKLVNQLLDVTSYSLEQDYNIQLSVIAIDTLLVLSYTEFAKTLVLFEISQKMWLQLLPPLRYRQSDRPWYDGVWNQVYESGLRLLTSLLISGEHHFVEHAISFVGIHEDTIKSILTSIRTTLKLSTISLVIVTLDFLRVLQQYKTIWHLTHKPSFTNINQSVQSVLDTCVSFLIHPHLIYVLVENPQIRNLLDLALIETLEINPSPLMVKVQNRLIDCATMCLLVIYPLSPSFTQLLTDFREKDQPHGTLLEINFLFPTLQKYTLGKLSFGTLITLTNLCTQALAIKQQHSNNHLLPIIGSGAPGNVFIPSESWLMSFNKLQGAFILELALASILAQALITMQDERLPLAHKIQFQRELMTEMATFLEYMKRNLLVDDEPSKVSGSSNKSTTLKRNSGGDRRHCARKLLLDPVSATKDNGEQLENSLILTPLSGIDNPEDAKESFAVFSLSNFKSKNNAKTANNVLQNVDQTSLKYYELIAHSFQSIFR